MTKVIFVTWGVMLSSALMYGVIVGIVNLIFSSYIDV
jgi:hypothetical protein